MTYSSLQKISNRVANGLKEVGLQKGERVILFMPKSMEQLVFHLGVQKVGAISVISQMRMMFFASWIRFC